MNDLDLLLQVLAQLHEDMQAMNDAFEKGLERM